MAPKNRYQRVKDVLSAHSGIMSLSDLRTMILKNFGSNNETVKTYLTVMLETNLIRDLGAGRFEIIKDGKQELQERAKERV